MKVLHVIPSLDPRDGGPTQAMLALAGALAGSGVEVHIATTGDADPGAVRGAQLHAFPRSTAFYKTSGALAQWLWDNVRRYDVLHLHALFSFAPVAAGLIAGQRGVPYIVRPLGTLNRWGRAQRPWFKQISAAALERRVVERAAAVQFTSHAEEMESREWGFRCRAAVIPNVAPVTGVAPATRGAGGRTALFLSRIDPVKGLDLLLPAFADVRMRVAGARLVVAGSGDAAFAARLRATAPAQGIEWRGFVDGAARERAFATADVFVLPSYSENFGLAAAEAMAHALPVVVSDRVAIHREIAEAGAGVVVPCDRARIGAAVAELLTDPQRRAAMGARGRRLVEDRYSAPAVASALTALYREVAR